MDINTKNTDHSLYVKYELIKIIKNIHLNKKGADKYGILMAAKDFTKEQIESTMEKLCEDNILNVKVRAGKETYRFTMNTNQETTRLDIERVEINDDDINVRSDTVISEDILQNDFQTPKHFTIPVNGVDDGNISDFKK